MEDLGRRGTFDLVSCQFAAHYAWSSEASVRALLSNVATALSPGGYFIGTIPDANVMVYVHACILLKRVEAYTYVWGAGSTQWLGAGPLGIVCIQ